MKRGIRVKLLATYILVSVVLLIGSVGVAITHSYTVQQYEQVINTMSIGYQLNQSMAKLIETYNELVLSNSTIVNDKNTNIIAITDQVDKQITYLDTAVVDPQAKISFEGLKNSIENVTKEVREGLDEVAQDKPTAFAHYQAAHRYYDFAQTNNTTFTYDQLRYINSIEASLHNSYVALEIAAGTFLVIAGVGSTLYGIRVARKIVNPLAKLSALATTVAAGKMEVDFDKNLLQRPDEIGSLAQAFETMVQRLRGKFKELEQEKATSEAERLKDEAILGSIGDAMLVTDSAGRVLLINDVAANLLNLDQTAVIGKSALGLYTLYSDDFSRVPPEKQPLFLALHESKKNEQNFHFSSQSGAKLSLHITSTPVVQQGALIGCIQIIRNVTHEAEIDRMKTEFISLASHQLRTPLSAIRWFIEMLLAGDAGKLKPEQREFAQNISESTQRMIELVNSLLNISRMESGRIIVEPKPTDLSKLVHNIINDLKGKTGGRNQTITIEIEKDMPLINLDERLVSQVYLNLLTNSIKYTPQGGQIHVTVLRKGNDVVTQVTDNGYGIPKAEQGKIFQKFFRASNIVRIETDGTGLGMYLVKAIVESTGGRVWFESDENKGTTFWFTIPMKGMRAKDGDVSLT